MARFRKCLQAGIAVILGIGGASPRQRVAVLLLVGSSFLSGTRQRIWGWLSVQSCVCRLTSSRIGQGLKCGFQLRNLG